MENAQIRPAVPLSPYYLHPNENPSLVLVQPPLIGSNYHAWSRSLRMALMSKNKLGFINGRLPAPAITEPDYHAWEQCNSMVLSWILNSISASIAQSVMWLDTAQEVWNDLKERFSHGDYFRLSDLLEEVSSVRQHELSVTDYYTKLKILWEELLILRPIPTCSCNPACTCGAARVYKEYFESECIIRFLKGLNDHFGPVKAQVMLMTPLPTINNVFGMAIKHERQLSYCTGHPDNLTNPIMAASSSFQHRSPNFGPATGPQNQSGVPSGNVQYPQRPLSGNRNFQCTYCGMQGHTEDRCYRKHGYPPGGRGRGRSAAGRGGRSSANQVEIDDAHPQEAPSTLSLNHFTTEQLNELRGLLISPPAPSEESEHHVNQAAVMSANFGTPAGSFEQEDDWIS